MRQQQKNYWPNLKTIQSKEILNELVECKKNIRASLIISDTGLGKSNSIEQFLNQYNEHVYMLTVGDSYKLEDVVNEICHILKVEIKERYGYRVNSIRIKLNLIAEKLQQIVKDGGFPMIILDEAENLKPSVLKMIKELYDAIIKYCSIVLIGTEQILDAMLNRRSKNRQSVPQLYRRFKAGIRYVTPINKARDFTPFFKLHISSETAIQDLLLENADNYGELHDYLEPVLRHADQNNVAVTEDLFRFINKMPNLKKNRNAA